MILLRPSSRSRALGVSAVLLRVLLLALLVTSGPPLHVHEADTPGFYNEQHILQGLAALGQAAPLPEAALAPEIGPRDRTPSIGSDPLVAAPAARHTSPRAPPIV